LTTHTPTPLEQKKTITINQQKQAITWTGFALCTLAFCGRVAIRIVCFRRPFLEDYLMLASLIILLGACVVIQLCVRYIYMMEDVGNGTTPIPPPTFMDDTTNGLRGFAAFMVMAYTGIWLIKVNFLLFFSRLGGNQFTGYRAFWWAVLVFNVGAGATAIGLIDFPCLLDPAEIIIAQCSGYEKMMASNRASIISCSIDAVGDALSEHPLPPFFFFFSFLVCHLVNTSRQKANKRLTYLPTYSHHLPHLHPLGHTSQHPKEDHPLMPLLPRGLHHRRDHRPGEHLWRRLQEHHARQRQVHERDMDLVLVRARIHRR